MVLLKGTGPQYLLTVALVDGGDATITKFEYLERGNRAVKQWSEVR